MTPTEDLLAMIRRTGLGAPPILGGLKLVSVPLMTIWLADPLSTTQAVAKVSGGPWKPRPWVSAPDPKLYCSAGAIYAHPAIIEQIKQRVQVA